MGSIENISELCRLCLISDQVNVPIFDENPTKEQTFVKINSCLPVKVSRDDSLPKKICDGCSYKLDMCYTFRNASVEAEKQLLELLNQAGLSACTDLMSSDPLASTKAEIMVKQETFEPIDARGDGDTSDMGLDSHNYMMQQQKLAYPQDFDYAEASGSATDVMTDEPAPKRAKRAAALNKAPVETDDDDLDAVMDISKVTKAEDEDSEDVDQPEYAEVPSTSADEQPGPSGVGKAAAEAPSNSSTTDRKKPFKCDICFKAYTGLCELKRHKTLHREKEHKCLTCGQTYAMKWQLNKHMLFKHDKDSLFHCNMCSYATGDSTRLHDHKIVRHTRNFPYKCKLCPNKGYLRLRSLREHTAKEHEGKRWGCATCSKIFKCYEQYERHIKTHNPDYVQRTFPCQLCLKVLHSRGGYNVHMKKHRGEIVSHICDVCGKSLSSAHALEKHKIMHTGEKPFICEICGKIIATPYALTLHKRIHTKEKPFQCVECDKKFTQKCSLTIHMRYHTGERPFTCDLCQKQFISRSTYNVHKCKPLAGDG